MKLAVGVRDPAHLRDIQASRLLADPPLRHLTRHMPRRAAEILPGGSLYWVIGGHMLVRQPLLGIEPARRADGTACTALLFDSTLVPLQGRQVKAFQGWRYLRVDEAPPDLDPRSAEAAMPPALVRALRELGLL